MSDLQNLGDSSIEKDNLCETCRKRPECVLKGIFERETCSEYEPMPLDDLLEQDGFVRGVMVGDCPKCGSENTCDCENNPLAPVQDNTVGYCSDCGIYWCLECGHIFKAVKKGMQCPHWQICAECSEDKFMCPYGEDISECPKIKEMLRG